MAAIGSGDLAGTASVNMNSSELLAGKACGRIDHHANGTIGRSTRGRIGKKWGARDHISKICYKMQVFFRT